MDLSNKELNRLVGASDNILISGPSNPNLDVLASAIAWQLFLLKENKKADICFDGQISQYGFLPERVEILKGLGNLNKFKIILDISKTKVKQLSYDMDQDNLIIDVVPEGGIFNAQDVTTDRGEYKYDLIITLGADDLESLGKVFSDNRHFFYSRPIVNLDISVLNENFGQLNVIESSSTSLAELSYNILSKNIDRDMATCLLSGMIMATNSFQSPKVTPNSLDIASQLIIKGAKREQIIEGLYRTKDIRTLKSWGKVLSRLHKQGSIISAHLNHDELENLPKDFADMVKDLILSTPGAQVAVIFYQLELSQTEAWIYSITNINAFDLVKDLGATGNRYLAKVIIDKDLAASQTKLIEMLTKKLDIINSL